MHEAVVTHHSFKIPVLGRLLDAWHGLRRRLSASERTAGLLRLPRHDAHDEPGLVLVQIDGLSLRELRRGLDAGRLPNLRRLLDRESYALHSMYSGLPSTTPAVQAEIFYGRRSAVPAFVYAERSTGRIVKMLSSDTAAEVEARLKAEGNDLLAGGSAYSNIYTGGATEPHFCAASLGWGGMFREANWFSLPSALAWNIAGFTRIVGRLVADFVCIAFDLARALLGKLDLKREWEFIPSRLGVGTVLQELITMAACVDLARGLPIVQLNYLAYDERGHLRGPESKFAHRALRRIDAAIGRLWKAAHRATGRHYAVWIYGDHGQESTLPYDIVAGRTFESAVTEAFAPLGRPRVLDDREARLSRTSYLRRQRAKAPDDPAARSRWRDERFMLAAIGPVGHIYLPPDALAEPQIVEACRRLVCEFHVPMVVRRTRDELQAWTSEGEFLWPRDAARLLGDEHPFLAAATEDVAALCRHADSGDVLVFGWRKDCRPISFVKEYGAHAGVGPHETGAFALLPADAPTEPGQNHLRPDKLRAAALRFSRADRAPVRAAHHREPKRPLRVVSYNVHSCVGLDGKLSPSRIARVLARCDADIVALQELDAQRVRTNRVDQAHRIAELLGFEQVLFHPALTLESEHYGDAVLSRLPMRLVRAGALPTLDDRRSLEPRGAIWAAVDAGDVEVQIVNTHLGLRADERERQVAALLGTEWTGHPECRDPVVLCGDFNARPRSADYRRIVEHFRDGQARADGTRPAKTWFSPWPLARIDYIFVRGPMEVVGARVLRDALTSTASDHLPVVVDLQPQSCTAASSRAESDREAVHPS